MTQTDEPIEKLAKAVDTLTNRAMVHEGLLSDCLALLAAMDLESMAALRDASMRNAAKTLEAVHDSETAQWRPYWTGRALLLEAVLAQAGAPWKTADIIDLNDTRD